MKNDKTSFNSSFLNRLRHKTINASASLLFQFLLVIWLTIKLISFKLWFQLERLFPRIPAFQFLSFKNFEIVDLLLAVGSFGLILYVIIKPNKKFILLLAFSEFLLCVFDVLRFQPFQFQMLLLSLVYIWKPNLFKINLILLLCATYLFAGLSKFNLGFINVHWAYYFLEQSLGIQKSITQIPIIKALGFGIPLIEIIAGLVLLTKYRSIGCKILIAFHVATLLFIGPFNLNINQAVWPWNLSMIVLLFYYNFQTNLHFEKLKVSDHLQKFYLLLLFAFPFLSFTNYYHPYASFRLYEGESTYLMLLSRSEKLKKFHDPFYHQLEPKTNFYTTFASTIVLDEYKVPVASVPWLHKRIIHVVEAKDSFSETKFYFLPYPYHEIRR